MNTTRIKGTLSAFFAILAVTACATPSRAGAIVASYSGGTSFSGSVSSFGFSFTTGASPASIDDLVMTIFSDTADTTPVAAGTGYLLSSAFAGIPAGLSSTSFLGSATAASGLYTFNTGVTLTANTQYWFYEDSVLNPIDLGIGNTGQTLYISNSPSATYNSGAFANNGINFRLTGDSPGGATTPEPSTLLLGLIGFACLGAIAFRRQASKVA